MKKGDVVVIDDGSYSRIIQNNELSYGPGSDKYKADRDRNYVRKQYVIIETGCRFPNTGSSGISELYGIPTFNNTVIQAIDSGKVVFIEERFLRPVLPKHKVMIDVKWVGCSIFGRTVEISDELYKEIKRDS